MARSAAPASLNTQRVEFKNEKVHSREDRPLRAAGRLLQGLPLKFQEFDQGLLICLHCIVQAFAWIPSMRRLIARAASAIVRYAALCTRSSCFSVRTCLESLVIEVSKWSVRLPGNVITRWMKLLVKFSRVRVACAASLELLPFEHADLDVDDCGVSMVRFSPTCISVALSGSEVACARWRLCSVVRTA